MLPQGNPYTLAVKKHVANALPKSYNESVDRCVDRVMHSMVTKQDVEELMHLLNLLYTTGYNTAFDNCAKTLKEHGLKINMVRPTQS